MNVMDAKDISAYSLVGAMRSLSQRMYDDTFVPQPFGENEKSLLASLRAKQIPNLTPEEYGLFRELSVRETIANGGV